MAVMPLAEFSEERRAAILEAVAQPKPPARWLRFDCGQIESRAWWEWHWARGLKLYRLEGSRRIRGHISTAIRGHVYARDGFSCLHCGSATNLSLDHIHPWSLGGADTIDNLQTLCRSCNSRKGARI